MVENLSDLAWDTENRSFVVFLRIWCPWFRPSLPFSSASLLSFVPGLTLHVFLSGKGPSHRQSSGLSLPFHPRSIANPNHRSIRCRIREKENLETSSQFGGAVDYYPTNAVGEEMSILGGTALSGASKDALGGEVLIMWGKM